MTDPVTVEPPAAGRKDRAVHLRSLDGIRALSILLVLAGHLNGTVNFGRHDSVVGDYAHFGVVVFFVVSGFLITTLLIAEHQKNGRVSLKLFYARRSLRIFPASFTYIACMAAGWSMGWITLSGQSLLQAATYTMNYLPDPPWHLGHLWSLSVEEQFYLIWPFVFVALGQSRATRVTIWVIAAAPFIRIAGRVLFPGVPTEVMFPMVADSLAAGCLLAMIRGWLERQTWYLVLFRPVCAAACLALVLFINRFRPYTLVEGFGSSIINLLLAVLIHRSVFNSQNITGRLLNWRPLAFIGVLSYSLYLWQQPFLNRNSSALMSSFPLNILLVGAAAYTSYALIERPLLRLRQRLRA